MTPIKSIPDSIVDPRVKAMKAVEPLKPKEHKQLDTVATIPISCRDYIIAAGVTEVEQALLLIQRESGCRVDADNPTSDAYGIPQALPGEKMASAGEDWRTNPTTQIRWMQSYIEQRYGTWANANAMWLSRSPHWY